MRGTHSLVGAVYDRQCALIERTYSRIRNE